jgi:hypothetical protein
MPPQVLQRARRVQKSRLYRHRIDCLPIVVEHVGAVEIDIRLVVGADRFSTLWEAAEFIGGGCGAKTRYRMEQFVTSESHSECCADRVPNTNAYARQRQAHTAADSWANGGMDLIRHGVFPFQVDFEFGQSQPVSTAVNCRVP